MQIEVRKPTPQEEPAMKGWPTWSKEPSEFPWHYDEKETCPNYVCQNKRKFFLFNLFQDRYAVNQFLESSKRTRPATDYFISNNSENNKEPKCNRFTCRVRI